MDLEQQDPSYQEPNTGTPTLAKHTYETMVKDLRIYTNSNIWSL